MVGNNIRQSAPYGRLLRWILSLWFVGMVGSLLAMSRLLNESPFQRRNLMMWVLVIWSSVVTLRTVVRFFKSSPEERGD